MSEVYLVPARMDEADAELERATETLWDAASLGRVLRPNDLTAIKLHVGEPGTPTYVRPAIARALVRRVAGADAQPFLTDTAVLYKSPRDNGVGHASVAHAHGFGIGSVGAPFVPADGLIGADEVELPVEGKFYRSVAVATGIAQARSMVVLTHATGHLGTGLGGALKNLGMGCAARKAKLRQHHGQQPHIDGDACTACGECAEWCPSDAISVDGVAEIDGTACIGCGECIAVCRDDAVSFGWGVMGTELQQRVAEHAAGIVLSKPGRIAFVTAVMAVTKDCDCLGLDQPPLLPDIGLLASLDPVALDRATLDLIHDRAGRTLESMSYPRVQAFEQLRHAERLGIGDAEYQLIEVER